MKTIGRGLNVFYKGKKVFWTLECIQGVKKCVCNKKTWKILLHYLKETFLVGRRMKN